MRAPTISKLLLIAILVLSGLLATGCMSESSIDDKEKALLLRARDLAEYGYLLENPERYESFTKTRYPDGSSEINYEFNTPDTEDKYPMYLSVTISLETKSSDAMITQGVESLATTFGLKGGGVTQREIKNFYSYGDSSSFYVLEIKGEPVGNMFTVRDKKKVYTLLVTGKYFDDPEVWGELMGPKLRLFSAYKP
jgi:hypothetical protein